jgi:hypothetical protein
MHDYLISLFIDDEMNLDEKITFVKTVNNSDRFADETIDFLNQEKLLERDVVNTVPPIVLPKRRARVSIWRHGILNFSTGLVTAFLAFFLIFPGMISDKKEKTLDQIPYRFVIYQPNTEKAEIVGSFTDWKAIPMTAAGDYWQITLDLSAGEHRFAYILDGRQQVNDPTIPIREKDDFGGENSILEVQWPI